MNEEAVSGEEMIALPLEAARALFRVYEAWMYKVDAFDPGHILVSDGIKVTGIGALLDTESTWLMEEVTGQVEPYEPLLRERLNIAAE